jgi:hypothetical protein
METSLNNIDLRKPGIAGTGRTSLIALLIALCLCAQTPGLKAASTGVQHEYEVKAGVLYHIIQYVDWPADSLATNPPVIQIGILGDIPFVEALEVLDGKVIQKRKLVVKRLANAQEAVNCQVLFIGASEKGRMAEIIAQLNNRPILTVGEAEGFAENGGMVNLVPAQNKIAMEINREAASCARLSFSSQVLKLAKVLPAR